MRRHHLKLSVGQGCSSVCRVLSHQAWSLHLFTASASRGWITDMPHCTGLLTFLPIVKSGASSHLTLVFPSTSPFRSVHFCSVLRFLELMITYTFQIKKKKTLGRTWNTFFFLYKLSDSPWLCSEQYLLGCPVDTSHNLSLCLYILFPFLILDGLVVRDMSLSWWVFASAWPC